MRTVLLFCFVSLAIYSSASAGVWSSAGDQKALKMSVIMDTGDVTKIRRPDNLRWNEDIFSMNDHYFIFADSSGVWGLSSKPGLLVTDKTGAQKLVVFEATPSQITVTMHSIILVDDLFKDGVFQQSGDEKTSKLFEKKLEQAKKDIEALRKKR